MDVDKIYCADNVGVLRSLPSNSIDAVVTDPPDGIVLDPFAGSGTTAIAAVLEGFHYLAIEKELKYFYIAEARVKAWRDEMLAGRVK